MKPPFISVEQVLALAPPCLRLEIPEAWADANGHMNMRWFVALFDDAGDELHTRIGLTLDFHLQNQTGTVDLEHHTNFLHEILPGESVVVYARLVARSPKRLHYMMFLVNETRGELAAIFECMNAFMDRSVRKTAPFPPEVLALMDAWVEKDATLEWAPPVSGAMRV